jgi:hypothetical protein
MSRNERAVLGFLGAPLAPGILLALFGLATGPLGETLFALLLCAIVGYSAVAAGIVYGLILYFGVWAGAAAPYDWQGGTPRLADNAPVVIALAVFFSTLSTLSFWFIARPDKP